MKDVIISIDFETYGPIPGLHSAASIGAVAYYRWEEISSFYAVFEELKHSRRDEDTMKFWAKQPVAWAEIQKNQKPPAEVMEAFYAWTTDLPGTAKTRIFAANPCCYDSAFLNFYAYKFLGERRNDMSYRMRTLDIRTYFSAMSGWDYSLAERYKMPQGWFKDLPINHISLDDARNQGVGLMHMMRQAAGIQETDDSLVMTCAS